jgi:hypothetical protein
MRLFLFALGFLIFLPGMAAAQNEGLDIVSEPLCFSVRNEADYLILGHFATEQFTNPEGIKARHRSNFRLNAAGSQDPETGEALDRAEFCSYGPFFEGRKLEIVLRTLFPVFDCKTKIDQGEIVIKGRHKPEGGVETWAECYE